MQAAFFQYDRDRSGRLEYNEIVQALQQGGFIFSPPVMQNLIKRFQRPNQTGLTFENFIQMCAFLGQLRFVTEFFFFSFHAFYRKLLAGAPLMLWILSAVVKQPSPSNSWLTLRRRFKISVTL
jgi:hypothetical protein